MSGADSAYEKQKENAIQQIASVSRLLREAIAAAIPVAPEQYLSIGIPGITIDTREIKDGGSFIWGAGDSAFRPDQVRQAESKLVDNMVPLSYVMLGNTGKSVARSYSRVLDCLIARKVPENQDARTPGHDAYDKAMKYLTKGSGLLSRTPVDTYIAKQKAWATAQSEWDDARIGAREKAQKAYPGDNVRQEQVYTEWNQKNYHKYKFAVQGAYMDWVANGNKYEVERSFGIIDVDSILARIESSKESVRNSAMVDEDGANEVFNVNLTPKNWATLCKQKSEGWFARNGEYSLDQLDAEIARLRRLQISYDAMAVAMGIDTDKEHDNKGASKYPVAGSDEKIPDLKASDKALHKAFLGVYESEGDLAGHNKKLPVRASKTVKEVKGKGDETPGPTTEKKPVPKTVEPPTQATGGNAATETGRTAAAATGGTPATSGTPAAALATGEKTGETQGAGSRVEETENEIKEKKRKSEQLLKEQRKTLAAAISASQEDQVAYNKATMASMSDAESKDAIKKWIDGKRETLAESIESLKKKRAEKLDSAPARVPVIAGAINEGSETDGEKVGTVTAEENADQAEPVFGVGGKSRGTDAGSGGLPVAGTASDPWVAITASFSASDQKSKMSSSSFGFSCGGSAGWGLFSDGRAYSRDQSSSGLTAARIDYSSDLAECDVSVTFSALVVNIGRLWLYGELFNDYELDVSDDVMLSPGAQRLHELMRSQKGTGDSPTDYNKRTVDELAQDSAFPAYPTSFIVAADSVIEFHGNTQHIEKHFSAQSNAGSANIGWGPFSVNSSFKQSSNKQSFQVQSTATGCRLSFGAPQIIGWVSQILPALPRSHKYEPMVQNDVTATSKNRNQNQPQVAEAAAPYVVPLIIPGPQ